MPAPVAGTRPGVPLFQSSCPDLFHGCPVEQNVLQNFCPRLCFIVMRGLDPRIHALFWNKESMDTRDSVPRCAQDRPGYDD